MKEIVIIGGGAAGMAAAITAASDAPNARITLLEGLDKLGKKILATGNGRCNLTNTELTASHYHSSSPQLLRHQLDTMPLQQTLDFFSGLHMLCDTEELGRVYPRSRQAATVRDCLLRGIRSHPNIHVYTQHSVSGVEQRNNRFIVKCSNGDKFNADAVILAAGGKASPKQGTDGFALALAKQLGHDIAPVYPCLTAFRCDSPLCKGLKGIRAHGTLSLHLDGIPVAEEIGEIQFTDYGISGIPAFQLSCYLNPGWKQAQLCVNLLNGYSREDLMQLLTSAYEVNEPIIDALPGIVHYKLIPTILKAANVSPNKPTSAVSKQELSRIADRLQALHFPVSGTLDWEQAQVTGGGVKLCEVNDDLGSKRVHGLWFAGEVLDVVGDCGGYNLHWAWCSGIKAGHAVAAFVKGI